ncbi:MAG: lycopene cyclase [Bacteroidetes bacterium]|nr:MAG: lycopene cyclase [Bacteroidota bacterium]
MPDSQHFDYIVLGAGCAGISLTLRILNEPRLAHKTILLLDRSPKQQNDRTWCWWEPPADRTDPSTGLNFLDHLVHHHWQNLWFKHPDGNIALNIKPYEYKLIRSIDFYRYGMNKIGAAKNVTVAFEAVTEVNAEAGTIATPNGNYSATQIFSSVLLQEPTLQPHQLYLLQHFRGWWIETDHDAFDPAEADLMNYHTSQEHGCAFVYVLPVSKRRALIEYTLFSEVELESEQYDEGLRIFIKSQLGLAQYTVVETEHGIIPMTDMQFAATQGKVIFIGTAGGFTKASTGYTFQFIQRYCHQLVQQLAAGQPPKLHVPARFRFYDSVFLRVLHERKIPGHQVFYELFKYCKASRLLRFLDNASTFIDELRIMNSTQKRFFITAAIKVGLRKPQA